MTNPTSDLPSLEYIALRAVQAAREFVDEWQIHGPAVDQGEGPQIIETFNRLDEGNLFAPEDESTWLTVEQSLIMALNDWQDGYGDYAAREDTCYDQLVRVDQERLRRLMESWKFFRNTRQLLIDRRQAARIAADFVS